MQLNAYFMFLCTGTGSPTMSTSSVRPLGSSCTQWPLASVMRSICTASGPSHTTRRVNRWNTTTTILWSTSIRPAPALTPCLWSSGPWARCTDRGRCGSTLEPVTPKETRRSSRASSWQHISMETTLSRLCEKVFLLRYFFETWIKIFSVIGLNFFLSKEVTSFTDVFYL